MITRFKEYKVLCSSVIYILYQTKQYWGIQVSACVALVAFEGVFNKCVENREPVPSIQEKIVGNNQIVR